MDGDAKFKKDHSQCHLSGIRKQRTCGSLMMKQSHGMMRKTQFVARFHCVLDYFQPADLKTSGIELLIIEADNDPLVEKPLREMLKTAYPSATIITLTGAGHFSYLNRAAEYTNILEEFFNGN